MAQGGGTDGVSGGAHPDAAAVQASGLFEAEHYRSQCGDGLGTTDPLAHYLSTGWQQGLSPHPLLDELAYHQRHPEAAPQAGLPHFLRWAADALREAEADGRAALAATAGDDHVRNGLTTVVLATTGAPRATARTLGFVVTRSEGDVEVVVVDNACAGPDALLLQLLADQHPNVRVVRSPLRLEGGGAWNLGAAAAAGDVVVFIAPGVAVEAGWLAPLRVAGVSAGVAGPRVLAPDGTVLTTGLSAAADGRLTDDLAGLAGEDPQAGIAAPRAAAPHYCFAVRADLLTGVGGFDGGLPEPVAAADLSLKLHAAGAARIMFEPASVVVTKPRSRRDRGRDAEAWHALRAGRASASTPADGMPLLSPARTEPRPVRWSIKIAAPFSRRLRWGDFHFAQGLRAALQRLGESVVVDSHDAWHRETARHDDVVLVLRGIEPYEPVAGQVNLLWVISHVDAVSPQEIERYDHAFVATAAPPRGLADVRTPLESLLQATDAERFRPGPREESLACEVLFVGNSRWHLRRAVRDARAAGLPLTVYGDGWQDLLPHDVVAGDLIPNEQLPRYYRSADVVLNDHWDDMRRDGLLSNRLFDLAACGATVVSDAVPGIEAVFGDVVHTYEDPAELGPLVRALLAGQGRPAPQRLALAEHVRRQHSFDARAQRLKAVAHGLIGHGSHAAPRVAIVAPP